MKVWMKDLLARGTGPCPDEEEIASFLESKLQGEKHESVAMHVLSCERCRDTLSAASGPAPARVRVPARLESRAVELVPMQDGPWEIVVKFVSGAIEVVRNTGDRTQYFAPAYAAVRGPGLSPGSLVAFNRRFAGIDAEIEIERIAPRTSEIKVTAKNPEGGSPKNIRVNLYKDGAELMSYMLHGGSAIFDKVQFGNYKIDFTRRGIRIGEIALEIKGE
jgi:hypothetical protein